MGKESAHKRIVEVDISKVLCCYNDGSMVDKFRYFYNRRKLWGKTNIKQGVLIFSGEVN